MKDELLQKLLGEYKSPINERKSNSTSVLNPKLHKNTRPTTKSFSIKSNSLQNTAKISIQRYKTLKNLNFNESVDLHNLQRNAVFDELDNFEVNLQKRNGFKDTKAFPAINLQKTIFSPGFSNF